MGISGGLTLGMGLLVVLAVLAGLPYMPLAFFLVVLAVVTVCGGWESGIVRGADGEGTRSITRII